MTRLLLLAIATLVVLTLPAFGSNETDAIPVSIKVLPPLTDQKGPLELGDGALSSSEGDPFRQQQFCTFNAATETCSLEFAKYDGPFDVIGVRFINSVFYTQSYVTHTSNCENEEVLVATYSLLATVETPGLLIETNHTWVLSSLEGWWYTEEGFIEPGQTLASHTASGFGGYWQVSTAEWVGKGTNTLTFTVVEDNWSVDPVCIEQTVPPRTGQGDFTLEFEVEMNFTNLMECLSLWGQPDPHYDMDQSGTVDFPDLLTLLNHWAE